jgi:hypothetical protein
MNRPDPADVLAMIADGGKLDAIADVTGLHPGEVVRIAREGGFALNVSSKRFQPVAPGKPRPVGVVRPQTTGAVSAPTADAAATPSAAPAPVPTIRPAHRDLIAEGKASTLTRTQRLAVKAEQAIEALEAALKAERADAARRQAEQQERERRRARIAELEAQLAAERAALAGKRATAAAAVVTDAKGGPSSKAVRAWAADAGIDCPASGPVPRRVVDAYEAAVRGGAA